MVWFQLLVFGLVGLNLRDGLVDLHMHTVGYSSFSLFWIFPFYNFPYIYKLLTAAEVVGYCCLMNSMWFYSVLNDFNSLQCGLILCNTILILCNSMHYDFNSLQLLCTTILILCNSMHYTILILCNSMHYDSSFFAIQCIIRF